jgi:hypothetical protein
MPRVPNKLADHLLCILIRSDHLLCILRYRV